jgi:hypothetical protein
MAAVSEAGWTSGDVDEIAAVIDGVEADTRDRSNDHQTQLRTEPNRTELTIIHGARTWCGHGIFAHNLVKIGTLAAGEQTRHSCAPISEHRQPAERGLTNARHDDAGFFRSK